MWTPGTSSIHLVRFSLSFLLYVYSGIDYFFLDKALLSSVISSDYSAIIISDHAPHILDIAFLSAFKSRPFWKFDKGLLARKGFCKFLNKNIDFFN